MLYFSGKGRGGVQVGVLLQAACRINNFISYSYLCKKEILETPGEIRILELVKKKKKKEERCL